MVDTKTELVENAVNGFSTYKFFDAYIKYIKSFPPPSKRRKRKVNHEKDRYSRIKKTRQPRSL